MSFGGAQYNLEYFVKVTGGSAGAGQVGQLNNAFRQTGTQAQVANTKIQTLGNTTEGTTRKLEGMRSNMRGLAVSIGAIFGTVTGVIAEFSTLQDAQQQVAASTQHLSELEKAGKKGTNEWSQAV